MNSITDSENKIGHIELLAALLATITIILVLLLSGSAAAQARTKPHAGGGLYDFGQWVEIGSGSASGGGISNNAGSSGRPSLSLGADGAPIIAWQGNTTDNSQIYVRRWNGVAWVEIGSDSASGGGVSNIGGSSQNPSLSIGADGAPIIAWQDFSSGNMQIYVRRWNGIKWVELGSGSASSGGISNTGGVAENPSLSMGADGAPIVTWEDTAIDHDDIYVRRWNGAAWLEMGSGSASGGGISNSVGGSWYPSLAAGADGLPIIAWADVTINHDDIYVRRWNGVAWVEMGSGSASGGGISDNRGVSRNPSLAIDAGGWPIIAWADDTAKRSYREIYVRRWNGVAWVEVGNGSASGGGISNSDGDSWWPSLAIRDDGAPIVAWQENLPNSSQIYARRWNGIEWVDMGSGSASGEGISSRGFFPSLAIGANNAPIIAWEIPKLGTNQIYVKRWKTNTRHMYLPVGFSGYYSVIIMKGNQEQEPNDSWDQANGALASGTIYHGAFGSSGDRKDYFYFHLAEAGAVTLELSDIPTGHNYDLVLRDSDLKEVGYSGELNNDDELINEYLPRGLYYIQVYNRDGGTSTKQYALQVNYGQ